jgi:hypothetical protein
MSSIFCGGFRSGWLIREAANDREPTEDRLARETVGPSDADTIVTFAVNDILASHVELMRAIKALSDHIDALDHITDTFSNSDTRALLIMAQLPSSRREKA